MNGNGALWQIGCCGFCGARAEDIDRGHAEKCRQEHIKFKEAQEKDPAYQLKRIADLLAQKKGKL